MPVPSAQQPVLVRAAYDYEIAAVGDLTADTYVTDGLVGESYVAVLRDAAARAADPGTEILVAVRAGDEPDDLLGAVAYTRPGSAFTDVGGPGEAGFRMLVTAAGARGHGVGELLVRACIEKARAERLDQLVLFTADSMTTAHRLYARLGFSRRPWRDRRLERGAMLRAYALPLARLQVRTAKPGEYDEIGHITVAAYTHDGLLDAAETSRTGTPSSDYGAVLRDARARSADGGLLVAVAASASALPDETVIGTVTYAREGSDLADVARTGEAEFRMLAVAPGRRGLGAGAALVHAVLDLARRDGAAAVVLSTQDEASAARHLYSRLGFVPEPERDWEPIAGLRLRVLRRIL